MALIDFVAKLIPFVLRCSSSTAAPLQWHCSHSGGANRVIGNKTLGFLFEYRSFWGDYHPSGVWLFFVGRLQGSGLPS